MPKMSCMVNNWEENSYSEFAIFFEPPTCLPVRPCFATATRRHSGQGHEVTEEHTGFPSLALRRQCRCAKYFSFKTFYKRRSVREFCR